MMRQHPTLSYAGQWLIPSRARRWGDSREQKPSRRGAETQRTRRY